MQSTSTPPNVIVFLTDQQRHDSAGLHGNPLDLTPNFDRLAREHTHLAYSFTCQPLCGPARACLQTGQYATTTGVWRNGIGLAQDAVTLAKCFNAAGYRTGYIGKWHLAGQDNPLGKGAVPEPRRGGYQDWLAAEALELTSDAYHTRLWNNDNEPVDLPGYRVDALTDAAIRYIDARCREGQPFFLFLSHLEPHHQNHLDDYPAPRGYRQRYMGRWTPPDLAALIGQHGSGAGRVGGTAQQHLGGYWGMVKRLDEAFGRLMDALISLGIDDRTIVLFTSDHACHFKTRNGEYKRSCHESSIRVPTLLTGPGFKGGGEVSELVSLVDLPPTLLDACGLSIPSTMEGRSILPLLRGQREGWPDDVFVQISESHTGRAVRTRRWKYAVAASPEEDAREGRASRYVETELYDLECDPYELTNLIHCDSHAPVREVMRQRLRRWVRQIEGLDAAIIPAEACPTGQRSVTEAEAHA